MIPNLLKLDIGKASNDYLKDWWSVVEMTKKWKNQVGGSQELELAGDLVALHSMMLREILYK